MELWTQKENHSEAYVEQFIKTLQRCTALNIEHKNLLLFILVGNLLPNIKKQIKVNAVGWGGQFLDIIQAVAQIS